MLKRLLGIAAVLALIAVGTLWWAYSEMLRQISTPLALEQSVDLIVEPGDSFSHIARELETRKLIADRRWLTAYAQLTEAARNVQAGEYEIQPGDSASTLIEQLREGRVRQYHWTIVPGWTWRQAIASLDALPLGRSEDLNPASVAADLDLHGGHPEGWLLPETYAFVRGADDLSLVSRAAEAMNDALSNAWALRGPESPLATRYELLILASIIEKETSRAEDRPLVAAVFHNRLHRGMRLQTDPTVIYGLGEAFDGNLTRRHLRTPTPYNTYTEHGLPPTPIAMPSREALLAAAQPANSDAYYFVARGDGSTQFSRTLEEHEAAVRRYQLGL